MVRLSHHCFLLPCCFFGILIVTYLNIHVATTTTSRRQQQQLDDNSGYLRSSSKNASPPPPQQPSASTPIRPPVLKLGPIFYNIYVPDDHDDATAGDAATTLQQMNALRIIEEQLKQRDFSDPDDVAIHKNSPIHYTLIGNFTATDAATADDTGASTTTTTSEGSYTKVTKASLLDGTFCQPNCKLNQHIIQNGNEVNTMQALYDYCMAAEADLGGDDDYDDILVTYIHDKGSYHNTKHNEGMRRMATKAAIDCRYELMDNPTRGINGQEFNVCTGKFLILPQYLSSANMWTTKCSYVKNLIPPVEYESKMYQMYNETLLRNEWNPSLSTATATDDQQQQQRPNNNDNDYYNCLKPMSTNENHLGLGRYAYERWIWSHPNVVPSEVVPYGQNSINYNVFPQTWYPHLGRGGKNSTKNVGLDTGYGISNYARLEGRLYEWKYLYDGLIPSKQSWIWSYYKTGYETGSDKFMALYCNQ